MEIEKSGHAGQLWEKEESNVQTNADMRGSSQLIGSHIQLDKEE